jgi:Na+-driven multidrug efflux pump
VLINELLWGLGVSVQSAIFGHITYGTGNTVAAYSVVNTIQQLGTILMFGIASATGVIVGRTIGEGKIKTAKDQSDTFRILALAVGVLSCGLLLLIRSPMVAAFALEPLTSALAEQMMIVTAFNVLFVSFSSIFIVGVLRGAGDTRFCLILEMGSLWCVSLPVAFVMSVFLRLPVPVVLIGMRVDEVIKAVACMIHTRNEKWIRVVARDSLPGQSGRKKRTG